MNNFDMILTNAQSVDMNSDKINANMMSIA